jgi:hypothetical protein
MSSDDAQSAPSGPYQDLLKIPAKPPTDSDMMSPGIPI